MCRLGDIGAHLQLQGADLVVQVVTPGDRLLDLELALEPVEDRDREEGAQRHRLVLEVEREDAVRRPEIVVDGDRILRRELKAGTVVERRRRGRARCPVEIRDLAAGQHRRLGLPAGARHLLRDRDVGVGLLPREPAPACLQRERGEVGGLRHLHRGVSRAAVGARGHQRRVAVHGVVHQRLDLKPRLEDLELAHQLDLLGRDLNAQRLDQPQLRDASGVLRLHQCDLGAPPGHVGLHRLQPRPGAHLLPRLGKAQVLLGAAQLALGLRGPLLQTQHLDVGAGHLALQHQLGVIDASPRRRALGLALTRLEQRLAVQRVGDRELVLRKQHRRLREGGRAEALLTRVLPGRKEREVGSGEEEVGAGRAHPPIGRSQIVDRLQEGRVVIAGEVDRVLESQRRLLLGGELTGRGEQGNEQNADNRSPSHVQTPRLGCTESSAFDNSLRHLIAERGLPDGRLRSR